MLRRDCIGLRSGWKRRLSLYSKIAGSQVEVTWFWSRSRNDGPQRRFVESGPLLSKGVVGASGSAKAGSSLALLLRDSISRDSQSFLLFPWDEDSGVRTGVIGFSESEPPVREVPDAVLENLKLLGWADWSVKGDRPAARGTANRKRTAGRAKTGRARQERITGGTKYQRGAGLRVSARSEPQAKDHPGGTLGRDPRWTRGTNSGRPNRQRDIAFVSARRPRGSFSPSRGANALRPEPGALRGPEKSRSKTRVHRRPLKILQLKILFQEILCRSFIGYRQ